MWWMRTCAGFVFGVTLANRLIIKENELLVWPSFIWPSTSIIHMHTRTHWHCTQRLKRGRWLSNSIQNILAKGQEEQNDRNMKLGEMVQCSCWCSVHVGEQLARPRHLTKSERALCDTNTFCTGTTLFVINYPLAWNVSECVSSVLFGWPPCGGACSHFHRRWHQPRAELQGLHLDAASLGKVYFDNNSASKKILSGGNLTCHGNNFCYPAYVTNITFEDRTA